MARACAEVFTTYLKSRPAVPRVVWFVGLWCASVLTLGVVAITIKQIFK
jgi:hypothetical protein